MNYGGLQTTRPRAVRTRSPRPGSYPPSRSYGPQPQRKQPTNPRFFIVCGAAVVLVALAIFAVLHIASCASGTADDISTDESQPTAGDIKIESTDFSLTPQSIQGVPTGEGLQTFSLSDLSAAELSSEQSAAIQEALADMDEQGDVGFVFIDVDTGRGISYNPDTTVYGASSIKGPYAVYVCELVDDGLLTLDSMCPVSTVADSGSWYGRSGQSSYPVSDLIEASVVNSDNNAFGFLRDAYDSIRWDEWSAALGASDVAYRSDSWFPWYCARSSAELWAEAYNYLSSGTETATWLAGLFESTETSFIRDGLDGIDCTTMTKAGWIADSDPNYNGTCDAGIIEADGHTYLMSIMTGMPYSESNHEKVSALAAALFNARDALGLHAQ